MEEHVSWITHLVNHYLGGAAMALLTALHITPDHPDTPIPEHVVMSLLVLAVGTLLALWVRSRLSVDRPGASQQIAEYLITNPLGFGIRDLLEESVHYEPRRYIPVIGTVGLFILLANLFGAFPFLTAPTVNKSVPLGCASLVFIYFVFQGMRVQGPVRYIKHFGGDVWWLSPLIFPVEIISTTARVLSLTVRLWANILASDLIYGIFVSLLAGVAAWGWEKSHLLGGVLAIFPAVIPVLFLGLHIFVSVIQAYIFTILPSIYLGLATEHEL
jgi:F-type H+-transporting ATPase subunit a